MRHFCRSEGTFGHTFGHRVEIEGNIRHHPVESRSDVITQSVRQRVELRLAAHRDRTVAAAARGENYGTGQQCHETQCSFHLVDIIMY
mgnify:CR=1 FL=1